MKRRQMKKILRRWARRMDMCAVFGPRLINALFPPIRGLREAGRKWERDLLCGDKNDRFKGRWSYQTSAEKRHDEAVARAAVPGIIRRVNELLATRKENATS